MADLLSGTTSCPPEFQVDLQTLFLAQKTELISELTRATANQFNNIMMAISSYAELEMKSASASQRRSLEQVLSNAARATDLVQKLLAVSRKNASSFSALDLNSLLTGIRGLLGQLSGEGILVEYQLAPGELMVNGDASEIEQVVLSLAINARNAMAKQGTLTIRTAIVGEQETINHSEADIGRGDYTMLSIEDTDQSSTAADTEDGFSQDERMNLSLATVRGIVKNAGGFIRFNTNPGKGSSFNIYLPLLKPDNQTEHERSTPRNVPVARTILVVEDDDAVRIPTAEFLKMEGFKVLQARTGEEAMRVVQQNRSGVDVLITDIVMPKMTGCELAEKLLALRAGVKVLYMSGDSNKVPPSLSANHPENAVLKKPFRLDTLKDRIHELVGE